MKYASNFFIFLSFLLIHGKICAQSNDNCDAAIEISDVNNYCSDFGAFNNVGATASGIPETICIPDEANSRDVWFKFKAIANFINIKVIGADPGNPGGTLTSPQLTLYGGNCGNLSEITCSSDAFYENKIDIYIGPIIPGNEYYVCIGARDNNVGTFQLCLNNYNHSYIPDNDCPDSRILCDKYPVYIEKISGSGVLQNEIPPGTCLQSEIASSWFRWTCSKSGTLTLKITPYGSKDDIDFGVFHLPGGINDCPNKVMIRCEAAGENVGQDTSLWIQCTGPTGLNLSSSDVNEDPGCNGGNDNWVKYIDMVKGQSYALVVNNFSNSGKGYYLEFGGTGEFLGAKANFTIDPPLLCYEDSLQFIDLSTQPTDSIIDWSWEFGSNSIPSAFDGQNPPLVKYQKPGYKFIRLTITTEEGCVSTVQKSVLTKCCINPLTVEINVSDTEIELGNTVDLNAIPDNEVGSVQYNWTPENYILDCFDCASTTVRPVDNTTFAIQIQDDKGCIADDTITIRVDKIYKIYAPNVFTPNHDGINDHFTVFTNVAAKSIRRLLVFNRWGACVYEGNNLVPNDDKSGWDGYFKGKKCNPGTFAWYAEVEFFDGKIVLQKGDITILE